MSTLKVCDYCGQPIETGHKMVTISAQGQRVGGEVNGYLGHYHGAHRHGENGPAGLASCYELVREAVLLMAEWGPIASRGSIYGRDLADLRRRHAHVCDPEAFERMGERWIGELQLHSATYKALTLHVDTIRELCALTTDELCAIKGVGGSRADEVIEQLALHGLALAAPATTEPLPPSRQNDQRASAEEAPLGVLPRSLTPESTVNELHIGTRAYNALTRNGADVMTLAALAEMSFWEVRARPGMGQGSHDEIRAAMREYGFDMKNDDRKTTPR